MLTKILSAVALVLVVAIAGTTAIAFVTGNAHPGINLRELDPLPDDQAALASPDSDSLAAFTGIRQIRAVTKPNPKKTEDVGTPVVIAPWFAYPENDTAFYEELARKSGVLTSTIVAYFSEYTQQELIASGEQKVKNDLMELINAQLVLGKISDIYFTDYIFLE